MILTEGGATAVRIGITENDTAAARGGITENDTAAVTGTLALLAPLRITSAGTAAWDTTTTSPEDTAQANGDIRLRQNAAR